MKRLFLSCLSLLCFEAYAQDAQTDAMVGKFQNFYNGNQPDSVFMLFSNRIKTMLPLDKTTAMIGQMQSQMGRMQQFVYAKTENKQNYYRTTFEKMNLMLVTSLDSGKFQSFRFMPDDITAKEKSNAELAVSSGKLYGTLTVPESAKKVPVVLLIAGSGPTDRNCNNNMGLKTDAFKMLADSLKAAGIACLRYDKRGIGESAQALTNEENLRIDTFVSDAINWIKYLKNDQRFSEVIVAGHSEGSLIGILAAQKEKPAKFISIAGSGESLDKTISQQLDALSPETGKAGRSIMDSMKKGYTAKTVPDDLLSVFRPSIQPYLNSELFINPAAEIKKLKIPVLIVQGGNDLQVSEKNATILKQGLPSAKLNILPNMNHCLKDTPADRSANFASYSNPKLPLSSGLTNCLIQFIRGKGK